MNSLLPHHKKIVFNFYEVLKHIKFINCGGCGVFAKTLHEILINLGYKPKIVLHIKDHTTVPNYKEVYSQLKKNKGDIITSDDFYRADINWFHISIKIGRTCYDSNGVYAPTENLKYVVISETTLQTMLKNPADWHPYFNRRHGVPQIKKALSEAFLFI